MNRNNSDDQHPALTRALRDWKVIAPLPPRFQENVWSRIERDERVAASPVEALWSWLRLTLARPAFATAYIALLAAAGISFGMFQAHQKNAQLEKQLETRYVQFVDPYQRSH